MLAARMSLGWIPAGVSCLLGRSASYGPNPMPCVRALVVSKKSDVQVEVEVLKH